MTEHKTDHPSRRASAPQQAALLTRQQAAAFLGVSTRTFDRMRQEATIPFVMIGKRKKFLLRDLEAFLQEQRSV